MDQDLVGSPTAEPALYRAFVETTDDLLTRVDAEGRFTYVNPAAERIFGLPPARCLGRSAFEFIHPDDREATIAAFARWVGDRTSHVKWENRQINLVTGAARTMLWTVAIEYDAAGAVSALMSIARDITARKEAELELARRLGELKRANEALQEADRYKNEFLSVISHELRTPLNFIMGFASVLAEELLGPLNDEQNLAAGRILLGADRMLGLVENLIDIANIRSGRLELVPAPTDYDALVAEALSAVQPLAAQRGQRLSCAVAPLEALRVDGARIRQVLMHLLTNAVKFTPAGGAIALRVRPDGGQVLTEVVDSGEGIAPEHLTRLFRDFSQIDMSSTRAVQGTGLGLVISQALVEAHGGEIGVESAPGAGSTFWFTLPRRTEISGWQTRPAGVD